MSVSRRAFLTTSGKAGLAFAAMGMINPSLRANANRKRNICIFSKHLQWLDYDEMARTAAEIGFNGVDLTVRPKGHVLPENAARDLPRAFKAIQKAGIQTVMITTAITDASDPASIQILKTSGELGVPYYRMGWLKYDQSVSIQKNLEQLHTKLQKLAEVNQKYNIRGSYQNHSGTSFGSAVWDLGMILDKINSPWLGCQYDIRHASVEGAQSWPLGLKYISGHINTIDIKDFTWQSQDDQWQLKNMPLGEGIVDFKRFFDLVDDYNIQAPLSIHYEYDLGGAEHGERKLKTPSDTVVTAIRKDLDFLRKY